MRKNSFLPRRFKKVQMQGDARSDGYPPQVGAGVLSTYVAAAREWGNAADGPFSAACSASEGGAEAACSEFGGDGVYPKSANVLKAR